MGLPPIDRLCNDEVMIIVHSPDQEEASQASTLASVSCLVRSGTAPAASEIVSHLACAILLCLTVVLIHLHQIKELGVTQ